MEVTPELPVVVIGGGIAGLTAAREVRRRHPGRQVLVLEGSDRVGGKLRLEEVGGVTLDVGAESLLARRPEAVDLVRDVGLGDDLVHPATTKARIWSRGRLCPLPRSVMGIPGDLDDLRASGILSAAGMARVEGEPGLPRKILDGDLSVGDLVVDRFGTELLDRVVEPLLGGVYAGHAREISARAAIPQVVALLAGNPSLLHAAEDSLAAASDDPVFAGIVGGVGRLPQELARGLDVRLGEPAIELRRTPEGFRVLHGSAYRPSSVDAAAVVVALPPPNASRLLGPLAPAAATVLAEVEVASMAVVTMAFAAEQFPRVEGSGFLVPPVDGRSIKAATYSFRKWDWVCRAGADKGLVHLRASLGRHREERELQRDDFELVDTVVVDLAAAIGLQSGPVDWHVQRWGGGLPQYAVGHLDRVARIRSAVAAVPGLAVCGATYDGVGVPACIASAVAAADQVDRHLGVSGPQGTMGP
ncbi:protoporphyrinogen oxidase [Nocardioides marmoribigeumensis]|uniref:Coproporphyrinogen III oxidase n=1 Tax=Nocardioides marmoribigeumensis TaxID=433649 RepID=A0ABU2C1S5_9ACTN|nr:protoporphyrinogen oxidase [Nocardioides marmoribigeumensis]MDR7364633.1 oxygen-dependent protoporphyrinogen oxidase [Nocardioides marmoribigeumensis]